MIEYRCGKHHDYALPYAERMTLGRRVVALKSSRRGGVAALARAYGVTPRTAYRYARLVVEGHVCVCHICDRAMR